MKISAFAVTALLALTSVPALAGDPTGVWTSEKNDEGKWITVTIAPCGSLVCGVISNVHGGADPSGVGKPIIKGMQKYGENRWDDGEIYAPDDKEWYDSKMELISDNQLSVSGCVAFGLICRSQTWTRAQ